MAALDLFEGNLLQHSLQEEQGIMSAPVTCPSSDEDCWFVE